MVGHFFGPEMILSDFWYNDSMNVPLVTRKHKGWRLRAASLSMEFCLQRQRKL